MARGRYWIQRAIKRPGALRAWLKRNRKRIRAAVGEDPFTKTGKIKVSVLRKLRETSLYQRASPAVKRRINLAITLHELRRGG